jgi:hypothetical protein
VTSVSDSVCPGCRHQSVGALHELLPETTLLLLVVRVDGEDPVRAATRRPHEDGFLVVGSLPHRGREARDIDLLQPWRDAEDETALVERGWSCVGTRS